jgi:FKBP-type peptidyl-prolyl cis-trans isomerase
VVRAFSAAWSFVALVALCVLTPACVGNTTSPTVFAPFNTIDLIVGTGTQATSGSTVTVNYTGWLYDSTKLPDHKGVQFDTSAGRTPLSFTLGQGATISGFDQGVTGMQVGGTRRIVVPPSMGYGQVRVALIPPNATLIFDVTLLDVQ